MPLPKPKSGETKSDFISRCTSFAVKEGMPQDQAVAACNTSFKSKNQSNSTLLIEYNVPFTQSAEIDGDFTIQGIAINETTTSNGHKFIAEELSKAAHTLNNVPLLKDHNNSVDSIVGKVTNAYFNETTKNIPFKAIVKDLKVKQLIKDGLLNSVSVGAHVDPMNIEELENGDIVPHGITFKELSVCAIGADSGATFGVALNNAYQRIKLNSNENSISTERGEDKMTKENTISEKSESVQVKEDASEKILALLSKMDERLAKLESSDEDEEKAEPVAEPIEEPTEEPIEEEEEESEEIEEKGAYKMTQSYNSFGIERKSYLYN